MWWCEQENRSLRFLNLNQNRLTREGCEHLLGLLSTNKDLINIGIVGNRVPGEFAEALEKRLEANWKTTEKRRGLHANLYATVVAENSQGPWLRSKLTILGARGAGKTATLRSLLSEPFVEDLKHASFEALSVSRWDRSKVAERKEGAKTLTAEFAFRLTARKLAGLGRKTRKKSSRAMMMKLEQYKTKVMPSEKDLDEFERRMLVGGAEPGTFDAVALSCLVFDNVDHPAHSIMVSTRGVCLLVFDSREGIYFRDVAKIALRSASAPIFLVGTHYDEVDSKKTTEDLKSVVESMPNIPIAFYGIDNRSKSGVKELRDAIAKRLQSLKETGTRITVQWTQCMDKMLENSTPFVAFDDVKSSCAFTQSKDIMRHLQLSSDLGLIFYSDATQTLSETVILDRPWLMRKLRKLDNRDAFDKDTVEAAGLSEDLDQLVKSGIASRDLLYFVLGNDAASYLLELAKHSLLVGELGEEQFILPRFLVPTEAPGLPESKQHGATMKLEFWHGFIPHGLFERLLCDITQTQHATMVELGQSRWTVEVEGHKLRSEKNVAQADISFFLDREAPHGKRWVQVLSTIMTKVNTQVWSGRLQFDIGFTTVDGVTLTFNTAKQQELVPWFASA